MTITQLQRDELVTALFKKDVKLIRKDLAQGDTTYLWHILSGQGWTQYENMTDEILLETVEAYGLHNHEQNTEQKREWHITGRLPYGENDGGFYEATSLKGAIQEFIKDLRGCYDDETWQKHIDESLSDTEEGMVIIETAMEQGGEMHISCEQPITNEAKAI